MNKQEDETYNIEFLPFLIFLAKVKDSNLISEEAPGSPHWTMFEKLQQASSHRLHKE